MLRHISRPLAALGLLISPVFFLSGCDSSIAPPAKTLSPSFALADRGEEDELVVIGANDPAIDVPAVQSAVDQGGNVLLKGHFSFAAPPTRSIDHAIVGAFPTAAEILVSRSVNISGTGDDEEMATIDGGTIPFYVDAPGQRVTIDRIRFVQPVASAILAFAVNGLEVASNRIDGVVPFSGLASGIWVLPSGNIPTPTSLGHPENVSGSIRFVRNDIDMTGGTATDNVLGISVF